MQPKCKLLRERGFANELRDESLVDNFESEIDALLFSALWSTSMRKKYLTFAAMGFYLQQTFSPHDMAAAAAALEFVRHDVATG